MTTTLVYSQQCPNCARFLDALRRTRAADQVRLVEVGQLGPQQLAAVVAVPALVTAEGQTLYGTKAFEWLKQFEGDAELDAFYGGGGQTLAFSEIDGMGYASYAEGYGDFVAPPS